MRISFNKIIFNSIFNLLLFLFLFIGIQNSTNKTKINLLITETINLPVGFSLGTSFIIGSIVGSFFNFNIFSKKEIN